ncbi:MAG: hypothetical protein MSH08_00215 [Ezakiella sp.]|nr:hypothetical protein [Ezakiella sp.]MCI6994910.1 hypothetical protein [Methanobrevibacter sp.]
MTNQEIIEKINTLMSENENFCDLLLALKNFNKEYKKSDFYKKTRISLNRLVRQYRAYSFTNLDEIFDRVQEKINNLDLSNIQNIVDTLGFNTDREIEDLNSSWNGLKDLVSMVAGKTTPEDNK